MRPQFTVEGCWHMRKILIVALMILVVGLGAAQSVDAKSDKDRQLTFSFCYAQFGYGKCIQLGLAMRMDTQAKVEAKLGAAIDDDERLKSVCEDALLQEFEDYEALRRAEGGDYRNTDLRWCEQLWNDYGCEGEKEAGLLYHRDSFCKYE